MIALFKKRAPLAAVAAPQRSPARQQIVDALERMKAAMVTREQRQRARERVEAQIGKVDPVAAQANADAEAVIAITREWAAAGANGEPPSDPVLTWKAHESARALAEVRLQADGASRALPAIQEAESAADIAVQSAKDGLHSAASVATDAELERVMARLEEAHQGYSELWLTATSFLVAYLPWSRTHALGGVSNYSKALQLARKLRALALPMPDDLDHLENFRKHANHPEIWSRAEAVAKFPARLVSDPDAVLDL